MEYMIFTNEMSFSHISISYQGVTVSVFFPFFILEKNSLQLFSRV